MRVRSSFVSARGVRSEARLERADDEGFRERAPRSFSLAFSFPSELAFRTSFISNPFNSRTITRTGSKGAWGQQLHHQALSMVQLACRNL